MLKQFLEEIRIKRGKVKILTKSSTDYEAILIDFDFSWIKIRMDILKADNTVLGEVDILVNINEIEFIAEMDPTET